MKLSARCPECAGGVQNLPRNAGRGMIWIYRHTLSPLVGFNCRHLPTCSVYGDEAIARFGLWAGGWMTLARLLRSRAFEWTAEQADDWRLPWEGFLQTRYEAKARREGRGSCYLIFRRV